MQTTKSSAGSETTHIQERSKECEEAPDCASDANPPDMPRCEPLERVEGAVSRHSYRQDAP